MSTDLTKFFFVHRFQTNIAGFHLDLGNSLLPLRGFDFQLESWSNYLCNFHLVPTLSSTDCNFAMFVTCVLFNHGRPMTLLGFQNAAQGTSGQSIFCRGGFLHAVVRLREIISILKLHNMSMRRVWRNLSGKSTDK